MTLATDNHPACADQYFGRWLIAPDQLRQRLEMFRSGTLKPRAQEVPDEPVTLPDKGGSPFKRSGNVAIIEIRGEMLKGDSTFEGTTSTVRVRRAVRAAAGDPSVHGIMLVIDSPGGTVSGTAELADDVRDAAKEKPVHARIEDMGASAAYWVASQATRITANRTALVGSLGTMSVLVDESGALEKLGIKYYVVSTGERKGDGFDGAVSEEMIDDAQRIVDDINSHFMAAVRDGRKWTDEKTRDLFDGRVHVADKSRGLGLIDDVSSWDEAMARLNKEVQLMDSTEFAAHAAKHPDELKAAASGLIEAAKSEAHAAGVKDERDRVSGIASTTSDPKLIRESIISGASLAQVKDAVLAAQSQRIAELEARANAAPRQTGITIVGETQEKPKDEEGPDPQADPKARAEWEYDNGKATWKARNRDNYVLVRTNELSGKVKLAG